MLETEFARTDMILNDRIDGLMEQFKSSGTTFSTPTTKTPAASSTPAAPPLRLLLRRPGRKGRRAATVRHLALFRSIEVRLTIWQC